MKTILLLLFIYNLSFSSTSSTVEGAKNYVSTRVCGNVFFTYGITDVDSSQCNPSRSVSEPLLLGPGSDFQTGWRSATKYVDTVESDGTSRRYCMRESSSTTYQFCTVIATPNPNSSLCPKDPYSNQNGKIFKCNSDNGEWNEVPNPDPEGGPTCNDLFEKNGVAYTCNPNTNEATPIPNSSGLEPDPEDPDRNIPKCDDGYEHTSLPVLIVGGSGDNYTSWGCSPSSGSSDTGNGTGNGSGTGTGDTGSGSGTGDIETVHNPDGSTSQTLPDGTVNTLYPDGTIITHYPDGSTSVNNNGSNGSGGVSGGTGSGSGTGGAGTDGNTTNENDDTSTTEPETPVDETPVATSCSDPNLTLQEKMLCEMNAGMKKLNSESAPDNSLNNLIKDMNKDLNTNITAVNTNIKSTNQKLDSIKNLQQHQLSQGVQTNSKLDSIATSLNDLNTNFTSISDFITTLSELIENPSKIETLLNSKLNEVTNKFTSDLINDDSCGSISTISINYHGSTVPLLSQSFLDEYFPVSIMKTIIILTFAFSGFMNFFRNGN